MKKILSVLFVSGALALSATTSQAQVEVTFGPELGGAISGLVEAEDASYAGFSGQIGGASHIQIGRFFAVRPSVFYSSTTLFDIDYEESKIWLNRVGANLPLLFSYHFDKGSKLYVGGGPSLMYSIGGKYQEYSGDDKVDIKFGNSTEDDLKPLEIGLNLKMGFQFARGLSLGFYFNSGLTNIAPKDQYGDSYKITTMDAIGFSIGWMFGGNKED